MLCWRTDLIQLYMLTAITPTWTLLLDLSNGHSSDTNSGSFAGVTAIGTATTLTVSHSGRAIQLYGGTAFNTTLPLGSTMWSGATLWLFNNSTVNMVIVAQGSDFIYDPPTFVGTNSSITLSPGDSALLMSRGTTEWDLIGGSLATLKSGGLNAAVQAVASGTWGINIAGLAAGLSSTLSVSQGGTGSTTHTSNSVMLGNDASAFKEVAPGASGNILTSNGVTWLSSTPAAQTASIPSGAIMPFYMSAPPVGWTQVTSVNDAVLRVVSGSGGVSGGSTPFSSFNAQTATAAYTLQIADIPSHTHGITVSTAGGNLGYVGGGTASGPFGTGQTAATGSGGAHAHGMTTAIKYADFIIASKN